MREIRTLRLTWRGLETEPRDGLRHRQRAKAAGKQRLPIPNVTAPVFDPTREGVGVQLPCATRRNIYVRSARAGERVMTSISRFITQRLKLRVNSAKSAVDHPWNRSFLGLNFRGKRAKQRKIAPKALERFKARVKALTKRNQGRSLTYVITTLSAYLRGWIGYFGFCQTPAVLRDVDSWIRHRLRCLQWKHWKSYHRRKAELMKRGISPTLAHTTAWSAKGPWKISHTPGVRIALDNAFFDRMGLLRFSTHYHM